MTDTIELDLKLADRVGQLLVQKKETLAVAESVTAGHLQVILSLAANAMEFFLGGITAYNLNQKVKHLHVDPAHALACNCVSEKIAAQMADAVSKNFTSDWGIGITGYASSVPEKNIQQLYACYSLYHRGIEMLTQTIAVENNSPKNVRIQYTNAVMKQLLSLLQQ